MMLNSLCLLALIIHDRGGSRGRVQGVHSPLPPTWDDLRFSNTTGILQKKKKLYGLLVLKKSKRPVHPLLKQILDPPLHELGLKDKENWDLT